MKRRTYIAKIAWSVLGAVLHSVRPKGGKTLNRRKLPTHVQQYLNTQNSATNRNVVLLGDFISDKALFDEVFDPSKPVEQFGIGTNKVTRRGELLYVTFTVNEQQAAPDSLPKLECMATHSDGAHCGLGDWYPEIEAGIKAALKKGKSANWTTGWYGSKKEIASARLSHSDGKLLVEASVSDDFDTEGNGDVTIKHTTDLEKVRTAIYAAWDEAVAVQKDNRLYDGFKVLDTKGRWIETYIAARGDGHAFDEPPGDNYHTWGFQGDGKLPSDVKKKIVDWIEAYDYAKPLTVKGWTVKQWED